MNMQSVMILGRQPALGMVELESLYGADSVRPLGSQAASLAVSQKEIYFNRLGGCMKAARIITELDFTDWNKIEKYLAAELPNIMTDTPEGKIRLGLSVYGFSVSSSKLGATSLSLKKVVKASGRTSIRVVPNKAPELNTAQVIHNQLTGPTGFEILLIRNGTSTVVAQTFAVQDIESYAARDQKRPKRDARVGMLPPKLAQIIFNLAVGQNKTSNVLDPFCGTGVILQEAMLMGYEAYGSDLEPRMIEYTEENLKWLQEKQRIPGKFHAEVGDATNHKWTDFDVIAGETYLGQPFSVEPNTEKLQQVMNGVGLIHRKFLQNVAQQTSPGFRMCIAVPAWKTKYGFRHLKTLDSLEELGYTRMSFAHVGTEDLLYYRNNQIVARELVVLIRK